MVGLTQLMWIGRCSDGLDHCASRWSFGASVDAGRGITISVCGEGSCPWPHARRASNPAPLASDTNTSNDDASMPRLLSALIAEIRGEAES